MTIESCYLAALDQLKSSNQDRHLPSISHHGRYVYENDKRLVNICSNDYLGIASNKRLRQEFLQLDSTSSRRFGAASSRLLTGNNEQIDGLEADIQAWFEKASLNQPQASSTPPQRCALVLNSGYHANLGLLPALTKLPLKTLILADKLAHASIIDGICLSRCDYRRYRHNDHDHLRRLLNQADDYDRILIVTESLFSMDGDVADLKDLVALKQLDDRIELYVDEAHAIGVFGRMGLGLSEQLGVLWHIDYLVGTFGKALGSVGAFLICQPTVKRWLINTMRPLIFSTALPEVNHAWSRFILSKLPSFDEDRRRLAKMATTLREAVATISPESARSASHIVPYILGSNLAALSTTAKLRDAGFYALPIRPPTVPSGSARIRLVINSTICDNELTTLIAAL